MDIVITSCPGTEILSLVTFQERNTSREKKANKTKDAPSKPQSASTEEVVELSDKGQVDFLTVLFSHKEYSVVGPT